MAKEKENNNLVVYKQLEKVPQEAQKKITGGRLNGMTDIKPMWRIEKLTEVFGPVGIGWYTDTINKELIDGANGEKIAVVDIKLHVNYRIPLGLDDDLWGVGIEGSGGSSFIAREKSGLYTNDECFKMAYTDALSVACKSLGMGADVYWGDSKYSTNEITEEKAKEFRFAETSKAPNMTILETYEKNRNYLQWWIDKGKSPDIRQMILMLTDMKPTYIPKTPDEEREIMGYMQKFKLATDKQKEDIYKKYEVDSDMRLTIEQWREIFKKD